MQILDGYVSTLEEGAFASVRIKTEDFSNFLNCYYLSPSNVICSISNDTQMSFFVYLNLLVHQNRDGPIRNFDTTETSLTCYLPVYQE
jgi:hypothetical protein